jgi:hypothetical protein
MAEAQFNDAAVDEVFDRVFSYLMATGRFSTVNGHEPKSAPTDNDITCALWVQNIKPVRSSGLAMTSGVLMLQVRIYMEFTSQPYDAIDPNILKAVMAIMATFSADFQLGAEGAQADVRAVDLLGMTGVPLSAQAGYVEIDRKMYRVMTVFLPIIINDMFAQVS